MAIPQTHVLIQHDIDLHVEFIARVIRLDTLYGLDGLGEAHGEVKEDVAIGGGRGSAGEMADMCCGGQGPIEDDVEGEDEATEGVEPPDVEVVA